MMVSFILLELFHYQIVSDEGGRNGSYEDIIVETVIIAVPTWELTTSFL